jgi:putative transcriptional regulator
MSKHVVDELPSFATGHLPKSEVSRVEDHLRGCTECRREADQLDMLSAALSEGPGLVLGALQQRLSGPARFEHLLERLARLFDLSTADAKSVLARIDDPKIWEMEMAPGVWVAPVKAGPKAGGEFTALLKLAPGATFPLHTHGAEERVLLLEGGYRDVSGTEFWRGELDVRAEGTSHSFTGLPGLGCLCASVSTPPKGAA